MKYAKYILTISIILASFSGFSQVMEPGDPGGTPVGEEPLGGGAPVGSGTLILLGLGAAYGGYKMNNSTQILQEPADLDN